MNVLRASERGEARQHDCRDHQPAKQSILTSENSPSPDFTFRHCRLHEMEMNSVFVFQGFEHQSIVLFPSI